MPRISKINKDELLQLEREVQLRTRGAATFADAAQAYVDLLWERLQDSLVLARVFATVPFAQLPETNQSFVSNLVESAGFADQLTDATLVLSLMGSRGREPEWNDRRTSKGHVGIPLTSALFIDAIPMVSRLLKQMGLGLAWIDRQDTELVIKTVGSTAGVFYVRSAGQETDVEGRKIIAAQHFVEKYGVQTVFGLGGGFVGTQTFMTCIIFCSEELTKNQAEAFMPQVNRIKVSTQALVKSEKMLGR